MAIEAVVFDIGNVLLEWGPERFYDRVYGRERRESLFRDTEIERMNLLIDGGASFRETIYDWAGRYPDYGAEIRDWHDRWLEMVTPEIPHSVRLLRALKARGVPVFALTNFGADSFDLACRHFPFLTEFDRAYVSGRMRMLKPDPAIYAAVEADCGIAPGALLFADDRAENIAAAEARGWRGHRFTAPEPFAALLVAEGLLDEAEAA